MTTSDNPYLGLRNQALQLKRSQIHVPAPAEELDVFAFLMDWGMLKGTATVFTAADGIASIYLSSGGGFIGGQGKEIIRKAAIRAVTVANKSKSLAQPASEFPLPSTGEVLFYLLTDEGILTMSALERDLANRQSPLSELGGAAQMIISLYRSVTDKSKDSNSAS